MARMPLVLILKPRQRIACRRDRSGGMVTWPTLRVWITCLCGTLWLHAVQRIAWSLALHLCFSSFESHNQGIATRYVSDLRLCSLFWSKGTSASLGLNNPLLAGVYRAWLPPAACCWGTGHCPPQHGFHTYAWMRCHTHAWMRCNAVFPTPVGFHFGFVVYIYI